MDETLFFGLQYLSVFAGYALFSFVGLMCFSARLLFTWVGRAIE